MIILLLLFSLVSIDSNETAYNKSTEFVAKQIKTVQSFPGYHDATVTVTSNIYVVDSSVITDKGKKYYRCVLIKDGEEWKCHSVDIYSHPF